MVTNRFREFYMADKISKCLLNQDFGFGLLGAAHLAPLKELLSQQGIEVLDVTIFDGNKLGEEIKLEIKNRFDVSKNEEEVYRKLDNLISDFLGVSKVFNKSDGEKFPNSTVENAEKIAAQLKNIVK
ncbi:MAG: hypothetical protein HRK26_05390 [Rickettsiaceae bacterium H1]|nr:hypothetical protein [Rickettsiaceae bacterium H1]